MRKIWPLAVMVLVAAGCSEKKSTTIARWEGGDTGTKLVRVGDKLTYEARFYNENDEPTDPPYFNWTSFMSFNFPITPDRAVVAHRHPSTGVYQVDVMINVMGPSPLGFEFAREPFKSHEKVLWDVVVAPPYADRLVPLHEGPLRIAIGETRSIPAYTLSKAIHQIGGERTFHTSEGVSATSAAPAIASTDDRGRITGVSVGKTTITLRVNAVESPIEVEVVDEKLAPPADGTYPLLSTRLRSLTGGTWDEQPRHYQRLAFDSKGYPFTLAQPHSIGNETLNWPPLLLAEWTGTGFGATVASRFGEEVNSPQLAVDERGLPYIAYRTSGWLLPQFVLADRNASGVFRHRELPLRRHLATDTEQKQELWVGGVGEDQTSTEIAILPRKGGGAFVAYAMSTEPTSEELICRTHVRLVEATDDALNAEDVLVLEYPFNPVLSTCGAATAEPVDEIEGLGLLWPSDGGTKPDVVVQRFFASSPKSRLFRYHAANGRWNEIQIAPQDPKTGQPELDSVHRFFIMAGAGVPSGISWQNWRPTDDAIRAHVLDGTNYSFYPIEYVHASPPVQYPFAFRVGDTTWIGDTTLGPLLRIDPLEGTFHDDLSARWAPLVTETEEWDKAHQTWEVQGIAVNENRIHAIVRRDDDSVFFASTTPPEKARDTNSEFQGRLLKTGRQAYVGLGAPTVSPGGTRFAMLAGVLPTNNAGQYTAANTNYTSHMLLHFSEGGPIQALSEVDESRLPLFHTSGGALYELVFRAHQLQVEKWSDASKSFTPLGGVPVQYPPQASALVGNSLFALERQTNRLALWRAPDITSPVFTDLLASKNVTAIDDQIGLAGNATDVVVFALQTTGEAHILRFAQDGTQLDDVKATLPLGGFWETFPKKVVRHGNDLLVMQRAGNNLIRILKWTPGATSLTEVSVIDDPWLSFTSLVALGDGRLVFALQRNTGPDRWQAAIRVSSDGGVTWDSPVPVRPQGGYGQHVWGLSVDPTSNGKDLLLLMGDNASMRGFSLNDIQLQTSEHLMPTPDKVLVRFTVP